MIDNITTYCHISKITGIFHHITAKHSRSDIYERDQFLCSALVCVDKRYTI